MADTNPDPESASGRSEVMWEHLRAYVQTPPLAAQLDGVWKPDGEFEPIAPVPYPPASVEQLQQTEAELGFALPPELRRFYAEVANGGRHIGTELLYGAAGGYPRSRWSGDPQKTIGQLVSHSGWRLHPRIEEALLRHPSSYVIVDALPKGFLQCGRGQGGSDIAIDSLTGCIYSIDYWDDLPDVIVDDAEFEPYHLPVWYMQVIAPSLSAWFERWLDKPWATPLSGHEQLLPEVVETDDLPDPEVVWRGLYRFGPDWLLPPDDETDLAHDAAHAIYWTYVEDAEIEQNARYAYDASHQEESWEPPADRFVDEP